jgi:hypothetical protein
MKTVHHRNDIIKPLELVIYCNMLNAGDLQRKHFSPMWKANDIKPLERHQFRSHSLRQNRSMTHDISSEFNFLNSNFVPLSESASSLEAIQKRCANNNRKN